VADIEPEDIVVDFSFFVIFVSLDSGLPAGNKSKCGPGFRAPSQCETSTEMAPSKGASMSCLILLLGVFLCENQFVLTIVNVLRFSVSALWRIFLVGHSKLKALPSSRGVMEYTSSAYSRRLPSAASHIPSRNFMM
jgi:hypothetical protein